MKFAAKKILLATDGSEDAKHAARVSTDLVKATEATLYVAYAWHPVQHGYPAIAGAEYHHLYEREARRTLNTEVDEIEALDGIEVQPRLLQGTPVDAILDLSEELEPELLVLGSRGLGRVGSWLLGSVSEGIVHHSKFPVLVARGGHRAWPPDRAIVGDDGSEAAEGAAALAASIGGLFGAAVELLRAYRHPPEPIGGWSAEDRRHLDEARAREEDDLAKRAANLGVAPEGTAKIRVAEGDPADAILDAAGKGHRVLLAVGSRGLGAIGRARFGSVSSKVLRAAAGPVLIYPHGSRAILRPGAKEATAPVEHRSQVPS